MRHGATLASLAVAAALGATAAPAGVERHACVRKTAELRFRAADRTELAGIRFGRGKTAVVLAHERRGDACQWAFYGRRLAKLGYLAIAFDFGGYGDSRSRNGAAATRYASDVLGAVKAARRLGATKVFAVGASMGGTAVLVAGPRVRPPLAGVVSLSGPAVYSASLDATAAVANLRVPALYLAARNDTGGGFAEDP